MLDHKPKPSIVRPFDPVTFNDLRTHVQEIRRLFEWPGIPYHDSEVAPNEQVRERVLEGYETENRWQVREGIFKGEKFNRWFWHNLPLLVSLHHHPDFVAFASMTFGRPLKPSYAFLSMYGAEGICPLHQDRPQCQFTIDVQVRSDGEWPIYIDEKAFVLKNGEGLCYSGTGQPHYRKAMKEDGKGCSYMDLAFFHFVPVEWQGKLA